MRAEYLKMCEDVRAIELKSVLHILFWIECWIYCYVLMRYDINDMFAGVVWGSNLGKQDSICLPHRCTHVVSWSDVVQVQQEKNMYPPWK